MWKHVQAVVLLPFMVTVVIPTIILHHTGLGGIAVQRPAPWNMLMRAGVIGAVPSIKGTNAAQVIRS